MILLALLAAASAFATTGRCDCFAIDAGHIRYWGSHAPARSCSGYARDDALTKAHVECQRYSGFPETCVVKKSNCEMNKR